MEVPGKFKLALVGFRYWLLAFIFMATSTFLISCGGGTDITIITVVVGSIQVSAQDATLVADGTDRTVITALVLSDVSSGQVPMPGAAVDFTTTLGDVCASGSGTCAGNSVTAITNCMLALKVRPKGG